jgi:hypothetical protein
MRRNKIRGYQKLRVWMESLEQKRRRGEWVDHLMINESDTIYGSE